MELFSHVELVVVLTYPIPPPHSCKKSRKFPVPTLKEQLSQIVRMAEMGDKTRVRLYSRDGQSTNMKNFNWETFLWEKKEEIRHSSQ